MSISRAKGLMKLELYRRIFEKYSNIKFHENPCSGIQVVPFGPWDRHTDMNKLIVVFHNFANASNILIFPWVDVFSHTINFKTFM